jgi:ABC-type nitrate/sulfonate/bicarbonate transport system substrate-binding protein
MKSPSSNASRRPPPSGLPARLVAADALDRILRAGLPFEEALEAAAGLEPRDRALAYRIVATALRRLGTLRAIFGMLLERGAPRSAPKVETVLLVGAAQILFMDVPDHAAVGLSVEVARHDRSTGGFAGLINAVTKGANYKLMLDRGGEKPGFGSTTILVSNKMYEAGVTGVDKFALLKGARFAMQAPGGIDNYLLARGLQKAGIDPRTGAVYSSGLTYPDIIKSLGTGVTDAAQCPVPLAFLAETNKVGRIIGTGADIEPGAQLACWAMPTKFLETNRKAAVAFSMAHIHAARIFTAAETSKDPEIIQILSAATNIPVPLIEKAAPRWTGYDPDGMPDTASVMRQASFWVDTMKLIGGPVPKQDVLLDLSAAEEAAKMLKTGNPFT